MSPSAGAIAALVLLATASAVSAAERICEAPLSSGPALATSEADARVGAITSWRMKTMKKHGKRHADWGLAAEKVTECRTRDEGGFECITTARPCTVRSADEDLGI